MTLFVLGLKAVWRSRALLLFSSAGLAAVLGPLLLLYGFKFGIISGLLAALRDDPGNREIVFRGNYSLGEQDIARYRAMPEVGFVLPATRTIAARMEFSTPGRPSNTVEAGVYPSASGDPLLPAGLVVGRDQIALSAALAQRLQVAVGDRIVARNRRTMENGVEDIAFQLQLIYVVDRRVSSGDRAYVALETLFELEEFLDGYALPERGIRTGKPLSARIPAVASVRMYARTIEDVPVLDRKLAASGIKIYSKADEVAGILGLNESLTEIFSLIAAIGSLGYAVSLAANLLGHLERQRKHLSLLRLMGARRYGLLSFPLAQGLAIAVVGFALSTALFGLVATLANAMFTDRIPQGTALCHLSFEHFLVAIAGTFLVVGCVVVVIGLRLLAISPAEVLHAE
jgi:putative ABC transport system permease protein